MSSVYRTPIRELRTLFGSALQENVVLAHFTTAHVGGKADALLVVNSAVEIENAILHAWERNIPFHIFGSGSNVLISDEGIRGLVLINRAHAVKIDSHSDSPTVWAESGANLGTISRQVALRGLSGLEWGSTVPGSLGGAVYGNAGAFGGDMKSSLILAEILHPVRGKENWSCEQMEYQYRSSILKRSGEKAVILAARIQLSHSTPAEVQATMRGFSEKRRTTQPPGASLGSMFKNPPGDYAGRLIEAAGLKGTHIGGVEISPIHANFFVTNNDASAKDIAELIQLARQRVFEQSGIELELEVELIGTWPGEDWKQK